MENQPNGFRDVGRLATYLKVAAGASVLVAILAAWSGWLELDLLNRISGGEFVTQAEGESNDNRQFMFSILSTAIFVVTGILFLRWVYLSNRNARALGATGMKYTPGWAVGWYFVPIMAFWKPFVSMQEIFKASNPASGATNWLETKAPWVVEVWWLLFIVMNLTSRVLVRGFRDAETLPELTTASRLSLASDLLVIPAAVAMVFVIAKLGTWQAQKAGLPSVTGSGTGLSGAG